MNLIINCSSDRLQIWIGSQYHEASNRGLERSFGPQLNQRMREYPISQIIVINGPGSFTTLRVVCLIINLYKTLNPEIKLYHTTKTGLYQHLINPSRSQQMYVYIGQRNNMRSYDLTTQQHVMIAKSDITDGLVIDDVSDEYSDSPHRIHLSIADDMIIATRHDQSQLVCIFDSVQLVDMLHPHYLMEPNITK